MRTQFIYILIALIACIIYEVYLIGFYKYQDFQINTYIDTLEKKNTEIALRNSQKEELNTYIRTKAYQTFVAKATQNKKLPGEEVINIVNESDMKGNENIDVNDMIYQVRQSQESPTKNMTNPQKWIYILSNMSDFL